MSVSFEIIDGKFANITLNGKPVKQSFYNKLERAYTAWWFRIYEAGKYPNFVTGAEVELNTLEATIYMWCMNWYAQYERAAQPPLGFPIQQYDQMKYLILELNPTAYMELID